MKIVVIGDTHSLHDRFCQRDGFGLPDGDVLIHVGDVTTHGSKEEFYDFLLWFGHLPHEHKIFIAGNHDRWLEGRQEEIIALCGYGVTYLCCSAVSLGGILFYGSPWTPWHQGMAFNYHQCTAREIWEKIPIAVDVLVTHGPPLGILDTGPTREHLGCKFLLDRLKEIGPRLHLFGHIHESWGRMSEREVCFVNASNHLGLWKGVEFCIPHVIDLEESHDDRENGIPRKHDRLGNTQQRSSP